MNASDIVDLFLERGGLSYEGEGVTQLQHAWQCARLARQAGAAAPLQLAAWLHDLGHLMTDLQGTPTKQGIDDAHEHRAAQVLARAFDPRVADAVALHVQAKRYLVATQGAYLEKLSPDSIRSLALQGGPMRADEAQAFLELATARDALRLRTWDDAAKDTTLLCTVDQALDELRQLMLQVASLTQLPTSHSIRASSG